MNKLVIIIPLVIITTVWIGWTVIFISPMFMSTQAETINSMQQSEALEIIKATMDTHNRLYQYGVMDKIPNPKEYGFDMEIGYTDDQLHLEWCTIALDHRNKAHLALSEHIQQLQKLDTVPEHLIIQIDNDDPDEQIREFILDSRMFVDERHHSHTLLEDVLIKNGCY